ncbi:MAG: hypothetical protein ACKOCM_00855 [Cyanobacteriota bacterium]
MHSRSNQKVALALGVASVAAGVGNVAVKAGPALQSLNNLTNTAEFSINNTYGQSFSVDGDIGAAVTPFKAGAASGISTNFNATSANLTTNFVGGSFGGYTSVTGISASASATGVTPPLTLDTTAIAAISLAGATGTQTIGASISSTLFGPSSLKATSSFTNQLINDLSAF